MKDHLLGTGPTPTTAREYADLINSEWRKSVEGIIGAGQWLVKAKAELGHGEFGALFDLLTFTERTGQRLMAVADSPQLNATHGSVLPPSWRTLYELARLDEDQWAVVEPHLSPELERGQIKKLLAGRRRAELEARGVPEFTGAYSILLADPPWEYDFTQSATRRIENQYPDTPTSEIAAMDVPAADDSLLFLWATSPKLQESFEVIEGWGFQYVTSMVWVKDRIGMGYYARQQHELILIAKKGNGLPSPDPALRAPSVIHAPRGEHSEKPAELYEIIERCWPNYHKVELFARASRDGWTVWGYEADAA